MACETGKTEYDGPTSARKAIRDIRRHQRRHVGKKGKTPKRFYPCPLCGKYHLTSQSDNSDRSKRRRERRPRPPR